MELVDAETVEPQAAGAGGGDREPFVATGGGAEAGCVAHFDFGAVGDGSQFES